MNRLKDCWHLLNLPCEGMSRLASESLDRELTRRERAALRMHTFYCSACRRYLRQLKLITERPARTGGSSGNRRATCQARAFRTMFAQR